ncbi:MAG: hypothetical protein WC829_16810 [Hyphomicrobium sp.]|jgi:hypothetical protein
MTALDALLYRPWREVSAKLAAAAFGLAGVAAVLAPSALNAETVPEPDRVRGFFCNAKTDSINFLLYQARGENEEMAANAVNKEIATFSCAYYLPADAIYTGEHTVMQGGLVFKLHSYVFLPEKVERWSGSVLGSLQQSPNVKHDV